MDMRGGILKVGEEKEKGIKGPKGREWKEEREWGWRRKKSSAKEDERGLVRLGSVGVKWTLTIQVDVGR